MKIIVERYSRDCDGNHSSKVEYSADDFWDTIFETIEREVGAAILTGQNATCSSNWNGYGDGWKQGNVWFSTEEGYANIVWYPVED